MVQSGTKNIVIKNLQTRKILNMIEPWIERDEIIIISGPRRVGKTSVLFLLKNILINQFKIKENCIFYLNLENME